MGDDMPSWEPLDTADTDKGDPVKDIKDMLDALREQEPNFGINPATEFPTLVLRHDCGHTVGYYRMWIPRSYRDSLRSTPCPTCRA